MRLIIVLLRRVIDRLLNKLTEIFGDTAAKFVAYIFAAGIAALAALIPLSQVAPISPVPEPPPIPADPPSPISSTFIEIRVIEGSPDTNIFIWISTPISVVDNSGNRLDVTVGVLWDPYRWIVGSASLVGIDEDQSQPIENVFQQFRDTETRPIIAVGMASHENSENPGQEEFRADARADRLVALCQEHFASRPEIYKLNLGVHKKTTRTPIESAKERRVVLLVITRRENNADLDSGIRNALIEVSKNKTLDFDPTQYSNFVQGRFHVQRKTP